MSKLKFMMIAVFLGLLLVGTLMPSALKAALQAYLWEPFPWTSTAHFLLFAAATALLTTTYGKRSLGWVLLGALVLAVGTEILQHWVPGRHPRVIDVLIDLAGAAVGSLPVAARRFRE